jgi:IS30 family transposase
MKGEDEALDEFQDLKDHSCFKIERLYEDDGSEFKGVLAQFCNDNNIRLVAYKPNEGSKWRLGVIERFNRTLRRLIEKQLKMRGKMTLDKFML